MTPRETHNRDINPSQKLAEEFPALQSLILNQPLSLAFEQHERLAVRWKRLYSTLGLTALFCIGLVMLFFDYEFTLQQIYGVTFAVRGLGAVIAATGIGAQLWLIFGSVKENWLVERFACERLRCLKFQAFAFAASAGDPEILSASVAAYTKQGIARLDQELLGGSTALDEFLPAEHPIPKNASGSSANAELIRDGFKVYDSIRMGVQAQHFERQGRLSDERARLPATLSEAAFAIGGILACCQIVATAWAELMRTGLLSRFADLWLAFCTLLMFVLSAVLAVYQRGSGDEAHSERYRQYAREIARVRARSQSETVGSYLEMVEQMERIELRELYDFCRDGARSNYIF